MVNLFTNIVISFLLKLIVVKDVCGDVNCVKCKKCMVYASFQPSDILKSSKRI